MSMKRIFFLWLLAVLISGEASAGASGENQPLLIEPSSAPVPAGKVTLSVGVLGRTNGTYAGDYQVRVFPYFYKNEKGLLAMVVSDLTLAAIRAGKVTAISGTATASGKHGRCRRINALVTPNGRDQGRLKVTFAVGGRTLVFAPAYRIVKAVPGPARKRAVKRSNLAGDTGRTSRVNLKTGLSAGLHL